MLSWLAAKFPARRTARNIYGVVVAQSRLPAFYEMYGVPDTPEGRFELIVMHMALVLERLDRAGEPGWRLAQSVSEAFVVDMDDNMREMGVGDLAVPAKVKRAAAGLLDRAQRYRQAMAEPSAAGTLPALIGRLLLGPSAPAGMAERLAGYVGQSRAHLAALPDREVLAGHVAFAGAPGDVAGSGQG